MILFLSEEENLKSHTTIHSHIRVNPCEINLSGNGKTSGKKTKTSFNTWLRCIDKKKTQQSAMEIDFTKAYPNPE